MNIIRKQFKFEMAHQLKTCFSEACKNAIHGHSYILELYFKSDTLNDDGMVIDFGEVKAKINDYVNSWDHCLVMPNTFAEEYLEMLKKYNKKIRIVDYNPTAELMCRDIYENIKSVIPVLYMVKLHETDTGWAEYHETNCSNSIVIPGVYSGEIEEYIPKESDKTYDMKPDEDVVTTWNKNYFNNKDRGTYESNFKDIDRGGE